MALPRSLTTQAFQSADELDQILHSGSLSLQELKRLAAEQELQDEMGDAKLALKKPDLKAMQAVLWASFFCILLVFLVISVAWKAALAEVFLFEASECSILESQIQRSLRLADELLFVPRQFLVAQYLQWEQDKKHK